MRYLSLFSGIEAASVAWYPLGWECCAVAEIEPFPCAVLRHHYPGVPNLGDITKITHEQIAVLGKIDLVVGGFPCQDVSVAGERAGMKNEDGSTTRSGLFFDAMRIIEWIGPRWVVIENVPGLFSSNGGRDFADVVGEMAGCQFDVPAGGWINSGVAVGPLGLVEWTVLDAQYHGLAQRRRRVFLVRDSGNWSDRPPLFLEPYRLQGHPAPRREAGQRPAPTISARTQGGGGLGTDFDLDGGFIPVPHADTSPALKARDGKGPSSDGDGDGAILIPMLAHEPIAFDCKVSGQNGFGVGEIASTMRSMGRSGSHQSGGGHLAVAIHENQKGYDDAIPQESHAGTLLSGVQEAIGTKAFAEWGLGILDSLQCSQVLRQAMHGSELRPATFSRSWVVCCALGSPVSRSEGAMQSLREACGEGCPSQGWKSLEQFADELGAYLSELSQSGAQAERLMRDLWQTDEGTGLLRKALSAIQEVWRSAIAQNGSAHADYQVRRLIPTECEFLQGFPRGFLDITIRNKPAADGPKYKALGNSFPVTAVRWIGERIKEVDLPVTYSQNQCSSLTVEHHVPKEITGERNEHISVHTK
jgi:DNA (cytosine-5)-methyltransferase 1